MENLFVNSLDIFLLCQNVTRFFVQSGLPTTEAGSDLGVSGLVSPHHLRLRGPLVARYTGALRRLMRVFHAGRLESSLAGRGLDDPRRSFLCKFRGRSDRRYNRQTRALVVLVGATALPSAPGRTIFDLRPLILVRMDPRGCRVLCPDFFLNYSRSALTLLVKAQRSGAFIALFCLKIFLDPETIFALTSIFSLYGSPAYFRAAKSDFSRGTFAVLYFPREWLFHAFRGSALFGCA